MLIPPMPGGLPLRLAGNSSGESAVPHARGSGRTAQRAGGGRACACAQAPPLLQLRRARRQRSSAASRSS